MRELKFRAWDKISEQMFYYDDLNNDSNVDGSAFCAGLLDYPPDYDNLNDFSWEPIMQNIDLKDKNGKEIYEGDLLSWDSPELEEPEIFQVIYQAPCFVAAHLENPEYIGGTLPVADSEEYEVIGNIYENPELLTHNTQT